MLGIPTKSDAAKADPDFEDAVYLENMDRKLDRFRGAFTGTFPHNHVAEAYRDAGKISYFPLRGEVTDINPRSVPKGVNPLLQPNLVRDHLLGSVRRLREALTEARAMLDRHIESVVQTADHIPYGGLYPMVDYEECVSDYVFEANAIVCREGEGRGWKYTFNPYELANAILDDFERTIIGCYHANRSNMATIIAMMKAGRLVEDGANYKLLDGSLRVSGSSSWFGMTHQENHPAHALYEQNQEVAEASDLSLRFDELYLVQAGLQTPADQLLDPSERFGYRTFGMRCGLRERLNTVLYEKGMIVINGVSYHAALIEVDGEEVPGYTASGQTYQEWANLLALPVMQPNGDVQRPEQWAVDEAMLSYGVRMFNDPEAIDALLERYDFDTSYGNPTRAKQLKQLRYSLGDRD